MRENSLRGRRLALVVPAALYFLWLAGADWLNHFWTLLSAGSGPVAINYIQFYLFHAVGIVGGAAFLRRHDQAAVRKAALSASIVLTGAFTALMAFSQGLPFNIVCDLAGLFGGFLPAMLSYYVFSGLPNKGRGRTLGLAYGGGYLLHFILFVLAFPGQEGAVLLLKAGLSVCAILAAGVLALTLPACKENLWESRPSEPSAAHASAEGSKPAVFAMLLILLLLFSLAYSTQSYAATAVWLNQDVSVLPYARIFLVLGLFAGGIICDRMGKYFVLSVSFSLLAAGVLAILSGYMGATGFLFFSCAQFAAGLFSVFAWYMFIDTARYFRAPEVFSSLSLTILMVLKQAGYLMTYAFVTHVGAEAVAVLLFVANIVLIGAAFPFISRLFYVAGNLFVAGVRAGAIRPAQDGETPCDDLVSDGDGRKEIARTGNVRENPNVTEFPTSADLSEFQKLFGLSDRGIQVLSLTMEGFSIVEIGHNLGIAERTVKYHIAQNLKKTDTKTNKQLSSLVFKWLWEKAERQGVGQF